MKLVNVQTIKNELERLIRNYWFLSSAEAKYRCVVYMELSEWLDGLEVEEPSKDLEEAAEKAAFHQYIESESNYISENERKKFIEGAQWQKQQTMKDAIECEVKEDAGGYPYIDATELYDYENDKPLAKAGDKIKVVFIKDE